MPEIASASPAPSCYLLLFKSGIQVFQTLGTDLFSLRARVGGARPIPILQGDNQQRVDLLAVEDDEALDKAVGLAGQVDAVEIAPGGKEAHLAVMHDPHGDKIRMRLRHRRIDALDADWADDVAVAVRLENIGAPECRHPIDQHPARGGINDAMRQSGLVADAAGDQIAALLDKEIRPFLEPVLVDAVDIGGDQLLNAEPHG